ncbi:hypothetical protein D3C78_1440770 [compost metagenome]
MQQAHDLEAQIRRALLGKPKKRAKPIARTPGMQVIMTVRPKAGGVVQRFSYIADTIGRFDAQMQAEREAKKAGYEPHALIYIGNTIHDLNVSVYDLLG